MIEASSVPAAAAGAVPSAVAAAADGAPSAVPAAAAGTPRETPAAGPAGAARPAPAARPALEAMLEARSVAVVGASARPGSFGDRVLTELTRSPSQPDVYLVNPRYSEIGGLGCVPSLDDVPAPVDLVLMCVGDASLEEQMTRAAARGDRSAIVYGSVFADSDETTSALRQRIANTATKAGMAVCGGGCMGVVNVARGLRAIGYIEPYPLPTGQVALITHSGSAFSALLRMDRGVAWSLAVSSGQELVTSTSAYLDYALGLDETRVVALLLETLRDPKAFRSSLARAADAAVPVVALTVGRSLAGRSMVAAHSGALAGDDATWEALFDGYGVLRVGDLAEMADTLELLTSGRRANAVRPDGAGGPGGQAGGPGGRPGGPGGPAGGTGGIATIHDSGAERALVVDVAEEVGVGFGAIGSATEARLASILDTGLKPENPLDVWGTGATTREVFGGAILALAADPAVDVVALCVDLVHEFDGDTAYVDAMLDAWAATEVPLCLVTNLPSALDRAEARRLRDAGIPVLEGTRSGLLAMRGLLELREVARRPPVDSPAVDTERQERWLTRLAAGPLRGTEAFDLLTDYGLSVPPYQAATTLEGAVSAAEAIGWPSVLKTDEPGIAHKTEAGGVVLALASASAVAEAYGDMAERIGPRVLVMATAPSGTELALGIVRDALVGPVVVVGAGGVLVEILADRAIALPPVDRASALRLLRRLAIRPVLDGVRGAEAADLDAVADAVACVSHMAVELGTVIEALDVNPLRCGPEGALALDALVETRF